MGQALDDAAGEAFDKVAKISGLGYPGGVAIEKMALDGKNDKIKFPRAYLTKESLDFSFSGLKTAVSLYMKKWHDGQAKEGEITLADIAASFQESVVDVLVHKVMTARRKMGVKAVVMAGGVACNKRLRERLSEVAGGEGVEVYYPRPEYCTDNGAMIAAAGYHCVDEALSGLREKEGRSKFPIQELWIDD